MNYLKATGTAGFVCYLISAGLRVEVKTYRSPAFDSSRDIGVHRPVSQSLR